MEETFKVFRDIHDDNQVSYVVYNHQGNKCLGHFLGDDTDLQYYMDRCPKLINCDWR